MRTGGDRTWSSANGGETASGRRAAGRACMSLRLTAGDRLPASPATRSAPMTSNRAAQFADRVASGRDPRPDHIGSRRQDTHARNGLSEHRVLARASRDGRGHVKQHRAVGGRGNLELDVGVLEALLRSPSRPTSNARRSSRPTWSTAKRGSPAPSFGTRTSTGPVAESVPSGTPRTSTRWSAEPTRPALSIRPTRTMYRPRGTAMFAEKEDVSPPASAIGVSPAATFFPSKSLTSSFSVASPGRARDTSPDTSRRRRDRSSESTAR